MDPEDINETLRKAASKMGEYPVVTGTTTGALLGALAGLSMGKSRDDVIGGSLLGAGTGGFAGIGYQGYKNHRDRIESEDTQNA